MLIVFTGFAVADLGKRNWWAPKYLRPIHDRFQLSEHETPKPSSPDLELTGR